MTGATCQAVDHNPWLARPVLIEEITPELPGVDTYRLRFTDAWANEQYRFKPGQFNMLYLPGIGEAAISLSAQSAQGTWDHTIRTAGNVTRSLAQLGCGGSLGLRGPYGTSWPLELCEETEVVFVAGGVGLAPLRPAIYHLLNRSHPRRSVTLLYGARTPSDLLYQREYGLWVERGLRMQNTVDRAAPGWAGNVGVVPLLLDRLQPLVAKNVLLMLCGPEVMMRYTVRSALARGIQPEQIWVSLERNMQCAVGLCGHCQLGPAFICKDGPVFRYDRVEPWLRVEGL